MKRRIITAAIILAIVIPAIYFGGWWTIGLAAFACLGGVFEILKTGRKKGWNIAVYIVTALGALSIFFWWFIISYVEGLTPFPEIPNPYIIRVNVVVLAAFLIALLAIEVTTKEFMVSDVFYVFTITFLICVAGQGAIFMRESLGLRTIGFVVFCTYCCDTFALLGGKFFGKYKLAPITSPKKTWEGALMGVGATTILGVIYYLILPFTTNLNIFFIFLFSCILAIGAIWGDLIFSSIKRQVSIKDFGNLLPGHGGILDRIDSLLFNILLFISIYGIFTMGVFD